MQVEGRQIPVAVSVPNSWAGLLVWAAGRWGVGMIFGVVFAVGIIQVYADLQRLTNVMVESQMAQTRASVELANAIRESTEVTVKSGELLLRIQRRLDSAQIAPASSGGDY